MAAADVVVVVRAAPHGAAAAPASRTPFLLPASAVCCADASAGVPSLLAYYATLGVSLACFARAVWPGRVGAVLAPLGAFARRRAPLARADLRRLRAAGDRHAAPTGGRRASRLSPDIGDGGDEINVWRARGRSTIGVRRDLVQGLAAKKQLVGVVA